jgi:ketosteroid isomerase-like protein
MVSAPDAAPPEGQRMMFSKERVELTQELSILLSDYWDDVDTNWGRNAGDYYTDDAVFETPKTSYRGKAKIQQFYQWRIDRGVNRTAVHSVLNFRAIPEGPNNATCTWYLVLYANDGNTPHPSAPPIQIAYMTDRCLKGADGKWRYTHRKFDTWFEGGVPTTNPMLDDKK